MTEAINDPQELIAILQSWGPEGKRSYAEWMTTDIERWGDEQNIIEQMAQAIRRWADTQEASAGQVTR